MSTTASISIEEYDEMIRRGDFEREGPRYRAELIHGEILEMSPIGEPHEEVVDILNKWSFRNLNVDDIRIRIQSSIGLPELESCPEPDVVWVTEKSYRQQRPAAADILLVIEVADSSLRYDTGKKAKLYAAAGIADYWVVDLLHSRVEVFREPVQDGYNSRTPHEIGETIKPLLVAGVELEIASLFSE